MTAENLTNFPGPHSPTVSGGIPGTPSSDALRAQKSGGTGIPVSGRSAQSGHLRRKSLQAANEFNDSLTHEQLKELLVYDPYEGVFTWKKPRGAACVKRYAGTENDKGYTCISINGKRYRAHRLAWLYMTGEWPDLVIDHIDGNPRNNRFSNLREIPGWANQQNSKLQSNNTSGFRGVCWDKTVEKWKAAIKVRGKLLNLGHYNTKHDAYRAYLKAKKQHHHYQPVPREEALSQGGTR